MGQGRPGLRDDCLRTYRHRVSQVTIPDCNESRHNLGDAGRIQPFKRFFLEDHLFGIYTKGSRRFCCYRCVLLPFLPGDHTQIFCEGICLRILLKIPSHAFQA